MKKFIFIYLLIFNFIFATPDREEILNDPFSFSEYNQCFNVKASKHGQPFLYNFRNFDEVLWFSKEFNLSVLYVTDCDRVKKWRRLQRKK